MPDRITLTRIVLLFIASSLLWLAVAVVTSRAIVEILLPLLHWEISLLAPQFAIQDLHIVRMGLEDSILANVRTLNPHMFGQQLLPAGIPIESSTLAGHLLQPLVLMLSLVTTACLLLRRQCVAMVLISIPFGIVLVMLDVPLVLIGSLEGLMLSTAQSMHGVPSPWIFWMNFLNGGGRMALGLGAALAIISLTQLKPSTDDPTL